VLYCLFGVIDAMYQVSCLLPSVFDAFESCWLIIFGFTRLIVTGSWVLWKIILRILVDLLVSIKASSLQALLEVGRYVSLRTYG
jgi:hypothetical protein